MYVKAFLIKVDVAKIVIIFKLLPFDNKIIINTL